MGVTSVLGARLCGLSPVMGVTVVLGARLSPVMGMTTVLGARRRCGLSPVMGMAAQWRGIFPGMGMTASLVSSVVGMTTVLGARLHGLSPDMGMATQWRSGMGMVLGVRLSSSSVATARLSTAFAVVRMRTGDCARFSVFAAALSVEGIVGMYVRGTIRSRTMGVHFGGASVRMAFTAVRMAFASGMLTLCRVGVVTTKDVVVVAIITGDISTITFVAILYREVFVCEST